MPRRSAKRGGGLHRFREAEVEDFHRAIGAHFDIGRFQIAVDDALFVRGLERLRDLLRDGQGVVEWNRATRNALREIVALDEFHHESGHPTAVFEAVYGGDIRMVQ